MKIQRILLGFFLVLASWVAHDGNDVVFVDRSDIRVHIEEPTPPAIQRHSGGNPQTMVRPLADSQPRPLEYDFSVDGTHDRLQDVSTPLSLREILIGAITALLIVSMI